MEDRELLAAVGEALFGAGHWKAELADALGVGRRPLLRWLAGEAIPEGVWRDLQQLLAERTQTMNRLLEAIETRNT